MKASRWVCWLLWLSICCVVGADEAAEVRAIFKDPPRQYSTGPLWVWNDMLTEDQIRSTLRDLARQQIKQVWVHPRPGLMTPYLSEDWFRLWKVSLDEANRLDMNVWIYDENSYPSGFAGGFVPQEMPESRGRGLSLKETKTAPKWSPETVAVYGLDGDAFRNLTAKVKAGEALPDGQYLVAAQVRAGNSPWHGNRSYVNLLSPGVTEKFLEVTMEPYRRELGRHFGKRVPGVFTDEPNIRPAGGWPWSEVLAAEFKKRWGYDLLEHLPSLTRQIGDWRKVRHNYFQVLHEQFVEHWAKPYYYYCERNNLQFTGHYWDHDWPDCMGVPDNMAMYAWHQLPAIDCLMNQYAEHTHAQFGNVRMVKELSSVANQLGRKQTLCEIYGAGGWDLRFEDMKRIGDWLAVLGVNVMNQHLSYVTIRGARKRDHPQSFSYHAPWWSAYHVSAEYLWRVSAALTQGEQVNRVLVLQPTTTAWMYQGNGAKLKDVGESFFQLLMALEAAQVEYDIGCEDVIAHHGRIEGNELIVGKRKYRDVVVPAGTENLNGSTAQLLKDVRVAFLGDPPSRIDGKEAADAFPTTALRQQDAVLKQLLAAQQGESVFVERMSGDKGILFHHRRQFAGGQLLFLVNTSIEEPSSGRVIARAGGFEKWDPYTGTPEIYPFVSEAIGVSASFELPPSGSLLLFISDAPVKPGTAYAEAGRILPSGPVQIRRLEPNVLALDYVDVTAGGETRKNVYFYQANQFIWQKNGMDRNPWDSAVQFKEELISKTFPPGSGFEASYSFEVESSVPKDLAIVIERPDLYSITCNGTSVTAKKGDWWLDKAFGRIPIAELAKPGRNLVTIKASPFTMYHELEPAYLLGDFSLKQAASGFVVVPAEPLSLGQRTQSMAHSINPDGSMWLSGGIGFEGGKDDRAPWLVFDLGANTTLQAVQIWNYNENHVRDLTTRGAKKIRLSASASGADGPFDLSLGEFELRRGTGMRSEPETLVLAGKPSRYVRLEVLSNHGGVEYPASGSPADNGFVGLAEVQFLAPGQQAVKGVKVARSSSELPSHRRLARYVVDGSGLGEARAGWNAQGHPFYSAGVAYTERFNLPGKLQGRYVVSLPEWYGSVASVKVNGKPAGYIDAPPFECDVTKQLKRGDNVVEITIIGTPKNLLGPHHGNPVLGAAWPGNFQHGPNPGPPPGDRYSTVGYGLFEPFVLRNLRTASYSSNKSRSELTRRLR